MANLTDYHDSGLYVSEAEILRRFDAGQSRGCIAAATGFHLDRVSQVINYGSEAGTHAMFADMQAGSDALRRAIAAEALERVRRVRLAGSLSNSAGAFPARKPAPVARFQAAADDRRPFANGRDPCIRCGELGCAHQRPDEPRRPE